MLELLTLLFYKLCEIAVFEYRSLIIGLMNWKI